MELNLSQTVKQILAVFLLLILPLLVILLGITVWVVNAWYFILAITWFGAGIVFYSVIAE